MQVGVISPVFLASIPSPVKYWAVRKCIQTLKQCRLNIYSIRTWNFLLTIAEIKFYQLMRGTYWFPKTTALPKNSVQLPSQKDWLKKLCLYSAQRHRLLLHHNLPYYGISHFRILCVTTCLVANHWLHFEVNTSTSHGLHVWKLWKILDTI